MGNKVYKSIENEEVDGMLLTNEIANNEFENKLKDMWYKFHKIYIFDFIDSKHFDIGEDIKSFIDDVNQYMLKFDTNYKPKNKKSIEELKRMTFNDLETVRSFSKYVKKYQDTLEEFKLWGQSKNIQEFDSFIKYYETALDVLKTIERNSKIDLL